MFYRHIGKNNYLYSESDKLTCFEDFKKAKDIALPLNLDTEFSTENNHRLPLTVQCKGIEENSKGIIFCHQEFKEYTNKNNLKVRHPVLKEVFAGIDYLKAIATPLDFKFIKVPFVDKNAPKIYFDIYSHHALSELLIIFNGELKEEIKEYIRHRNKLSYTNRLKAGKDFDDSFYIKYNVSLYGTRYQVKIRIIDTIALLGINSYKNICQKVGLNLDFKDLFTSEEKSRMLDMYFQRPQDFDNYSLGDLEVFNILMHHKEKFETVYDSLKISEFFSKNKLKMTIGATVENLFKSKLYKYLKIDPKDKKAQAKILGLCQFASSKNLKEYVKETKSLLAKVFGGRCRNNKPLVTAILAIIIDLDIDGCYGNGLRNQLLPLGKPIIETYPINKKNNFLTLNQWLKERKYNTKDNVLVYGCWHAIVESKEILKYEQDLLVSWFNYKIEDNKLNTKSGIVKIFNNEVKDAVITEDFLDWLFYFCNEKQRNELLNKLVIKTSIYYPTYSKVESIKELIKCYENDELESYWLAIPLDNLIIDDLIAWRSIYPKKPIKHPLNELYKLIINTIYGIFASPFFDISNSVVGNNITMRARLECYYAEKILDFIQSITDGGCFNPNKVVYPLKNYKITASTVCNLYRLTNKEKRINRNIELRPLDNAIEIKFNPEKNKGIIKYTDKILELEYPDFIDWINQKSLEHLQKILSPNIRIFNTKIEKVTATKSDNETPIKKYDSHKGMFWFDAKSIHFEGCFHGSSNYYLPAIKSSEKPKIAMRSYENKTHKSYCLDDNLLVKNDYFDKITPSEKFLCQILLNPENIERSKIFTKNGILKFNEYANNFHKWENLGLECGDNIDKSGLLREFSQSQFTFKTIEQYLSIEGEIARNKRKYGQCYEGYFINNYSKLNYKQMIETIDSLISQGVLSINESLDKNRNRARDNKNIVHPEKYCLEMVKTKNNIIYQEEKENDLITFSSDLDFFDEYIECEEIDFELF